MKSEHVWQGDEPWCMDDNNNPSSIEKIPFPKWVYRASDDTWYFGALLSTGMKIAFESCSEPYLVEDDWMVKLTLLDKWEDISNLGKVNHGGYFTAPSSERPDFEVRIKDVIAFWELTHT